MKNNSESRTFNKIKIKVLLLLFFIAISSSAVELGNNVNGNIGLSNELGFSSLRVNNVQQTDNTGAFSIQAPLNNIFEINATMYDFQNTYGSSLQHTISNQGPLVEDQTLSIDLRRDSGRITGSVNVTGGTLEIIEMRSRVSSGNENFLGRSKGNIDSSYIAIQPMPALAGANVEGFATITVTNGNCTVTLPLNNKPVDVNVGGDSNISWDVDANLVDCSSGDLNGKVVLNGPNPYAYYKRMQLTGKQYKWTTSFDGDGVYQLNKLLIGSYNAQYSETSQHGEIIFPSKRNAFDIVAGTTTYDLTYDVGTATSSLLLDGPWGLTDIRNLRATWQGGGSTYKADYDQDGEFLLLGLDGIIKFYTLNLEYSTVINYDYSVPYSRIFLTYSPSKNFQNENSITIQSGGNTLAEGQVIQTSQSLVAFELSSAAKAINAVIQKLTYRGFYHFSWDQFFLDNPEATINDFFDAQETYQQLYASSSIQGGDYKIENNSPIHMAKIIGFPGTYQITATATLSTGGTEGATFQLILSEPVTVEVAVNAPIETFASPSGEPVGTIDFGEVTEAGSTTFSELTIGPDPEEGFSVFVDNDSGNAKYFDISTSAQFDGSVAVCVQYNGDALSDEEEQSLRLGHYVDSQWLDITELGYPKILNDTLCGLTDSFSYFAILISPEPPDSDGDGYNNADDNCPLTANPEQSDVDGDGIGDLCEVDSDEDGIIDDLDLCPIFYSSVNTDIDSDGIGDPCDDDLDGDQIDNTEDNCPMISNANQVDFDGDLEGDACDLDDDGDDVNDVTDQCSGTSYGVEIVTTTGADAGCTSGQLFFKNCPMTSQYRNHGDYVNCVVDEAERQVDQGILSNNEVGSIVSSAARSDIGKKP